MEASNTNLTLPCSRLLRDLGYSTSQDLTNYCDSLETGRISRAEEERQG